MKILVTGGCGFIGSNFVCDELTKGYEVINVDKLTYAGNLNNLGDFQNHPKHFFYQTDICETGEFLNILLKHQPNFVVHMAAESHVDRSIDSSSEFIKTNINGTHSVLEACLKYFKQAKGDFKFLHLSTDEVYGALGETGKFNENYPYKPNSPYAASKASSDLLVRSFFKTYGFPAIIVNCSNNYGPKQFPEKLMPLTILNALEGRKLPIYGDGKQVRDWLFVNDHINALYALLEKGKIGESYCIGSDNEIKNIELVTMICDVLDELKPQNANHNRLIEYVKDRPSHDFRYATDASKLKNHTGWQPETSFKDGLRQTVEWYVNNFENFKQNSSARQRQGVLN
jgi:dTDP-glucose 4,6-dehydratase